MTLGRRPILIIATGGVALGLVLLAIATGKSDATTEPPVGSNFSVLKQATPEALQSIPEKALESLNASLSLATLGQSLGARSQAQRSNAAADITQLGRADLPTGERILVASAGDQICTADIASGAAGCGSRTLASSGRLFGATPVGCDGYRVTGLMPDGVTKLKVDAGADGTVDSTLPVTSNVYSAVLKPVSTVLIGNDGATRVQLPLDWYSRDNDACGKR